MAQRKARQFALGVDYGTNSVRALLVDTADGREIASASFAYPSGEQGIILDRKQPDLARQHPADYVQGFEKAVAKAVRAAKKVEGFDPSQVVGIGVDTTGSTPVPVNAKGQPLAMTSQFKQNPAAMAWLWKDHTAHAEAAEISAKAADAREDYLAKCGGGYSSEWFWSKILHCKRTAPKVFAAAHTWMEQADLIPYLICGKPDLASFKRSICAAGHKCMYHEQWGGLPKKGFLASLAPELADLNDRLYDKAYPSDQQAGRLDETLAKKVGLPAGIPVAVGLIDAHAGAVGAGIKPGTLVKIIGTSTCDMMVYPLEKNLVDVPGLCGIVPHSIVPGMYGMEAGQSAVGDIFNWFVNQLTPQAYAKGDAHQKLTDEAAKLKPGESGLLALDWNNGNRTVLIDPLLTGLIVGQTLHTTAPEIYRALIEATAFGALTIIRRFEQYGVKVDEVVNCGGIAEKNELLMQIYADVCNRPMKLSRSAETCALGAAIFGAVVGGAHKDVPKAQKAMTGVKSRQFKPRKPAAQIYARLYALYSELHDAFGTRGHKGELHRVMKELIDIRNAARQ